MSFGSNVIKYSYIFGLAIQTMPSELYPQIRRVRLGTPRFSGFLIERPQVWVSVRRPAILIVLCRFSQPLHSNIILLLPLQVFFLDHLTFVCYVTYAVDELLLNRLESIRQSRIVKYPPEPRVAVLRPNLATWALWSSLLVKTRRQCRVTWVYSDRRRRNLVFRVDRAQAHIAMGDTWSSWQDNGNIMGPGQNIHHIATSEVIRPPRDGIPVLWTTYMRLLNCVTSCPTFVSYS